MTSDIRILFLEIRRTEFLRDRFFVCSLASALALNALTVTLTWLVVFVWKVGFEYNPTSYWQLATLGPITTLASTQLTLLGVFVLLKTGLVQAAKAKFRTVSHGKGVSTNESERIFRKVQSQYDAITRIVLSVIVGAVALDAVNDVTRVFALLHLV